MSKADPPTKRQREVLMYMRDFMTKHGAPPTIREIAKHFEFASENAVADHLKALKRKGLLKHYPKRSRGWVPLLT